jgi:hypothetical protein
LGDVAHESNLVDVGSFGVDGCLIMMANSNKKKYCVGMVMLANVVVLVRVVGLWRCCVHNSSKEKDRLLDNGLCCGDN